MSTRSCPRSLLREMEQVGCLSHISFSPWMALHTTSAHLMSDILYKGISHCSLADISAPGVALCSHTSFPHTPQESLRLGPASDVSDCYDLMPVQHNARQGVGFLS